MDPAQQIERNGRGGHDRLPAAFRRRKYDLDPGGLSCDADRALRNGFSAVATRKTCHPDNCRPKCSFCKLCCLLVFGCAVIKLGVCLTAGSICAIFLTKGLWANSPGALLLIDMAISVTLVLSRCWVKILRMAPLSGDYQH